MPPIPQEQCSPWPARSSQHPRAHSIDTLVQEGPFSKTFLYESIKSGRLKAKKAGIRTIILDDDYRQFLADLPTMSTEVA